MTAGRKPIEFVPQDKPVVDGELIMGEFARQVKADSEAQANAVALAKELNYDGALSVAGLEEEIRFFQRRSVEAVLETGKRLLLLKEVTGHGNFVQRIEGLGISYRMAAKFMSATLKFSKVNSSSLLSLPQLSQTKLLELLVLDEGEIEALNNGETVRGIVIDEIERLSVSELKTKLREADERIKAKDRVAADNQAALQRLQEQLAGKKPAPEPTPEFIADSALRDLDNESLRLMGLIEASLRSFLVKVAAPELELGDLLRQQAIRAAVGRVLAATHQLAQDFDVPVSGPAAAHENGELDEVWSATLTGYESGDDHASGS